MPSPSNDDLREEIRALSLELRSLRDEVERLKGREAPAPASSRPAAEPKREIARPVPAPPTAAPAPAPAPARPKPWELPRAPRPARPAWSFDEKFIGEKLTQYAGMVILALGILFFLIWTATHAGPEVRVAIAAGAGAVLIVLGLKAEKRPPYDRLAGTLIRGGWTVLYLTVYASHHFEATRILESAAVELALLLGAAAGMIGHAISRKSRPLRLYSVGLTYFVLLFCGEEIGSYDLMAVLFAASAVVAVGSGEADILLASLCGYYANYVPVYFHTITAPPDQRTVANFASPFLWLAGPYLLVAGLPLFRRARERIFGADAKPTLGEAALCLNAALFAVVAGSMGRVYFGVPHLGRAAALASLFAVPALFQARLLGRRSAAAGLGAVLALGLLAAAIFEMPDPMWKLLAWMVVSCSWVWIGLLFEQPVWRAAGLTMAMLTFVFYVQVAVLGPESRREASMAMFLFCGLAYVFSRTHRLWLKDQETWEEPATEMWLHAGSLALLIGLWGTLDAAPFLCVVAALGVVAEHAAVGLGRTHLWAQAAMLECGACVYAFFVDYGANLPIMGLTPRLLTTGVLAACSAYVYFAGPVTEELAKSWKAWTLAEARRALSWLAFAAVSFAVYREFDGRLRLPVWAFGCVGLLALGRSLGKDDFRRQGGLLAAVSAVEAVATYLLGPSQLLGSASAAGAVFYWSSCAALLGGLVLVKSRALGEPTDLDKQAAGALGALPLVLGACYLAKELDQFQLTLVWTGLGIAFLAGGLALDWRELRYPALGLLGLCVGKALLMDTANLPLPYRVASFVALGIVLLLASSLYVRAGARSPDDPKDHPVDSR